FLILGQPLSDVDSPEMIINCIRRQLVQQVGAKTTKYGHRDRAALFGLGGIEDLEDLLRSVEANLPFFLRRGRLRQVRKRIRYAQGSHNPLDQLVVVELCIRPSLSGFASPVR